MPFTQHTAHSKESRLSICLIAVALTAALVPAAVVAENVFVLDGETDTIQDDAQGAIDACKAEKETVTIDRVETTSPSVDSSDTELGTAADSVITATTNGGARIAQDTEPTDHQPFKAVSYEKHSWNGREKTTSRLTSDGAKSLPDDGSLTGGVYLLDADRSYEDRMVVIADTVLVLCDDCTLSAKAGIHVQQGVTLTVCAQDGKGNGRLVANAKTGAGIGAYKGHKGGDIVICGGKVEAHGGKNCAGIGSNDGDRTEVGSVTIFDGTVDATGGESGAGIGGGRASEGGHVSIHGGTVTAQGGHYAAGIGGGNGQGSPVKGAHAGTVDIWDGTITATGGDDAAGIGGGEGGNAGSTSIHGGTVTAQGGNNGAGIGCGEGEAKDSNGGTVRIDGGEVTARSGSWAAGIGGGHDSNCSIEISGGKVHAFADKTAAGKTCDNGAGIGGGSDADGGTINISGGTVEAVGSNDGTGIGGGDHGDGGTIAISGGTVTATAGDNGAGIGGGHHSGNGGNVTISGGTITANSQKGAAIGGGHGWIKSVYLGLSEEFIESGDGGTIDISGGTVTATSAQAFGIGAGMGGAEVTALFSSGELGSAGTITIGGDATVTARGALAGMGGDEGSIAIEGGDVAVHGIKGVSGYGIYFADDDGVFNMSGGSLTASGDSGNGTNGGYWHAYPGIALKWGNTVNITGGEVHASGAACPAIGSANGSGELNSSTDTIGEGTLNVSGKDTRVYASSPSNWGIGSKDGKVKVNVRDGATLVSSSDKRKAFGTKELSLYVGARVRAGANEASAEPCPTAQRMSTSLADESHYVAIEPCPHDDLAYEPIDDSRHKASCQHCGMNFKTAHTEAEDLSCAQCDWTPADKIRPRLDHVDLIPSGHLGLRFHVTLPQASTIAWHEGSLELSVAGKDGETFEVPLSTKRVSPGDQSFYFDCPLKPVQLADKVTATYCVNGYRVPIATMSLLDWATDVEAHADSTDANALALERAVVDYGYYTQQFLSREKGWTLGDGCDHEAMCFATHYTKDKVGLARRALSKTTRHTTRKGDTVWGVTMSVTIDSDISLQVYFKTKEQLVSAIIDGKPVSEEAVSRVRNSICISIDGIRASQLADTHDVRIETTGAGDTTTSISNVSVNSYVRAVLNTDDYAQYTASQNVMCALYNYYLASREA